ncbi:MAG: ABC transporter ATP-binding protein [Candidatus Tectimicrobiota bacterium]|nr:MAG: ABC transporter ATP-binding protein [Candidatus Tectomicrobia bacterium]
MKNGRFILETRDLTKAFGGLVAVQRVNLGVTPGSIHAIIGPNGAGKTTLFNLLSGHLAPTAGRIFFQGRDITGLKPYAIAQLGIGRSFQISSLFPGLSVYENVRLAVQARSPYRFSLLRLASSLKEVNERAEAVLAQVGLYAQRHKLVRELSHGDYRALEVGLALATEPRLLLLDEPTSGMSRDETRAMMQLIERIGESRTIVLIEHDMKIVMSISTRITVLHQGAVLAEGTPAEVRQNEAVQRAYLGGLQHA